MFFVDDRPFTDEARVRAAVWGYGVEAVASGLAAEDTLLRTIGAPGSHFVVPGDAYGGTFRLFTRVHARWGIDTIPAHLTDLAAVEKAIRPGDTTRTPIS